MSLYIIIISNNVSKIVKYYLKDSSDLNLVLIIKHENDSLILQFVCNYYFYTYISRFIWCSSIPQQKFFNYNKIEIWKNKTKEKKYL